MQPHAGETQVLVLILQVCCSQIDIPSCLVFTFHPQIGVCSDGLLMIMLEELFGQPVYCLPAKTFKGPTCRPLKRPLRRPLPSKPAFLKRFRVGQKLAISAEGSHCSGQLLRAITSSTVLSWKHGSATCAHTFSVLSTDLWSPCGRGGSLVILLLRCRADICCENGGRQWPANQPACPQPHGPSRLCFKAPLLWIFNLGISCLAQCLLPWPLWRS